MGFSRHFYGECESRVPLWETHTKAVCERERVRDLNLKLQVPGVFQRPIPSKGTISLSLSAAQARPRESQLRQVASGVPDAELRARAPRVHLRGRYISALKLLEAKRFFSHALRTVFFTKRQRERERVRARRRRFDSRARALLSLSLSLSL